MGKFALTSRKAQTWCLVDLVFALKYILDMVIIFSVSWSVQDVKLTEEKGSREKLEQEDGQTICLPAAETFTSESKVTTPQMGQDRSGL